MFNDLNISLLQIRDGVNLDDEHGVTPPAGDGWRAACFRTKSPEFPINPLNFHASLDNGYPHDDWRVK